MKFKIYIYYNSDANVCIDEKEFDTPDEIQDMFEEYEGYWCKIVNLETDKTVLEGSFISDYLDEDYYE